MMHSILILFSPHVNGRLSAGTSRRCSGSKDFVHSNGGVDARVGDDIEGRDDVIEDVKLRRRDLEERHRHGGSELATSHEGEGTVEVDPVAALAAVVSEEEGSVRGYGQVVLVVAMGDLNGSADGRDLGLGRARLGQGSADSERRLVLEGFRDELGLGEAHLVAFAVGALGVGVEVRLVVPTDAGLISLTVEEVRVETSRQEVGGEVVRGEAEVREDDVGLLRDVDAVRARKVIDVQVIVHDDRG